MRPTYNCILTLICMTEPSPCNCSRKATTTLQTTPNSTLLARATSIDRRTLWAASWASFLSSAMSRSYSASTRG